MRNEEEREKKNKKKIKIIRRGKQNHSPVRPQLELLHRVLHRDEVAHVEGDRVGEILGGGVCVLFLREEKEGRVGRG